MRNVNTKLAESLNYLCCYLTHPRLKASDPACEASATNVVLDMNGVHLSYPRRKPSNALYKDEQTYTIKQEDSVA